MDQPEIFQNSLSLPGFKFIYKTLQTFPKWFKTDQEVLKAREAV